MSKFTEVQKSKICEVYIDSAMTGGDYDVRSAVVAALAKELETTVPSIRGVLVSAKVYVAKEKTTVEKDSAKDKAALVSAFETITGKKLASMQKMTKSELEDLWDYIVHTSDVKDAESQAKVAVA